MQAGNLTKRQFWIVEQSILCALLAPLSLAAYFYWHRIAFLPGSPKSGLVLLLLISVSMMIGLAQVIALVPLTILAARAVRRRDVGSAARWLPTAITIVVFSVVVPLQMDKNFEDGVNRLVENGRPIIDDIESYRAENGSYPASLLQIYGESAVPTTGSRAYHPWVYEPLEDEFDGYELRVATPIGSFNGDSLVYRPSHVYPDELYGGTVRRFGDWAYVHE